MTDSYGKLRSHFFLIEGKAVIFKLPEQVVIFILSTVGATLMRSFRDPANYN
ncbi:MAG: hypothetical protein KDC34_07695 [Saprospiraceae bacterium]|nr:hypothetical protein [Saprospiraceae bacterium]